MKIPEILIKRARRRGDLPVRMSKMFYSVSLDRHVVLNGDDLGPIGELIFADDEQEDDLYRMEVLDATWKVLRSVDRRNAHIFTAYYMKGWTLDRIGRNYGITRERVRQIIVMILMKIRARLGIECDSHHV